MTLYERWAKVLVEYSTGVRPGDEVFIQGGVAAEPLLRAIYREVIRAGGKPTLLPEFTDWLGDLLELADDDQIAYISPVESFARQRSRRLHPGQRRNQRPPALNCSGRAIRPFPRFPPGARAMRWSSAPRAAISAGR